MWAKPLDDTPFFRDFGRLISRVRVVYTHAVCEDRRDNIDPTSSNPIASMIAVSKAVAAHISPSDRIVKHSLIFAAVSCCVLGQNYALDAVLSTTADCETAARAIGIVLGESSPTISLLKLIHQNVVLAGLCRIHASSSPSILLKDVRSPDGWQIHVVLGPSTCQLVHMRTEQPADASLPPFRVQWEVRCVFSRAITELTAVRLRMTSLEFGKVGVDATAAHRDAIRSHFLGGDLFLA
ncbi:hypothetical protein H310_08652 [Aphanomyces invadans]|uniref:Ras guanine nucleotide exchange factor glfB-like C-terminal domain-containing protein n=1 Tax=Aphanomyces invadans TaxID=157072 RepID=A0A024TWI6_9STRA|nr:hypothetical protein H310_08652 [Aphanomyces invadans]ETV98515.1 hypothetical protein H310_08652 [Aphanomyces invadans]|eukprot:XP_008872712.1 hypothetical protein H310_08652 [Aphanomyces invadans]